MRVDPVLRALRRDDAPQRRAQDALEQARRDWRERAGTAAVIRALADYGAGAPLTDCAPLALALSDRASAAELIDPLIAGLTAELARHPIGQIPFRHQYASGVSVLLLEESGRAVLSLVVLECERASQRAPPQSICFTDGERHELCLAGRAKGRVFALPDEDGTLAPRGVDFAPGSILALDGARETRLVDRVVGRLVLLRLARRAAVPAPSREYRIADGALIHVAGGDRREAREEMMVALLGRMGRRDAAPVLEAMAQAGSDHLRWQALRNCLALDPALGIAALAELAADRADPLSAPAASLRASLLAAHPELENAQTCPA